MRVVHRERISDEAAVGAAVGTQFPDLVDKPLAWGFNVLPGGISLAHSLVFGLPLCLLVVLVDRRYRVSAVGPAFTLGYLSHLLGDILYPIATNGDIGSFPSFLLWPLVPRAFSDSRGVVGNVTYYFEQFTVFLGTPRGQFYLTLEILFLTFAVVVWALDGFPGTKRLRRHLHPYRLLADRDRSD